MSYAASENPPVPFHAIDAGLVGKMHAELRDLDMKLDGYVHEVHFLLARVKDLENEVEVKDKIIQHLNGDAIVIDLE
mgnify:CR=1 FL=1